MRQSNSISTQSGFLECAAGWNGYNWCITIETHTQWSVNTCLSAHLLPCNTIYACSALPSSLSSTGSFARLLILMLFYVFDVSYSVCFDSWFTMAMRWSRWYPSHLFKSATSGTFFTRFWLTRARSFILQLFVYKHLNFFPIFRRHWHSIPNHNEPDTSIFFPRKTRVSLAVWKSRNKEFGSGKDDLF